MTKAEPIKPSERLEVIDVLRGLAVCGILIGNMQWFSGYGMIPASLNVDASSLDRAVHYFVHFFVEGKFYSIFSFLFGFGFALQIARAEERGDIRARVFRRRLFWLLAIGVLHATLLWAGDILSVYALMGFILLLFRKKSDQSLLRWSFWLVVVPIVTYSLMYGLFVAFVPSEALASFDGGEAARWNDSLQQVSQGSYFSLTTDYNVKYLAGRWAGLIIQMRLPKILAMFLLGVYAYRTGVFQNLSANKDLVRRVFVAALPIGIGLNIAFATLAKSEADFPPSVSGLIGTAAYAFGVPALAIAIITGVTMLWQKSGWSRLLSLAAPVGRMALTNYILQTVVCVTIFYGYGFGRFGQLHAGAATGLALCIFVIQSVLSTIWLRYFAYGPLEWIWRQLTYGTRLDLRRQPAVTSLSQG